MREEIRKNYNKLRQTFSLIDIDEETGYKDTYKYIDETGKEWLLCDEIDIARSVGVWCEQFHEVVYNTVFFIFGIGTVEYILEMQKRYPENIIVFFEPCQENIIRIAMDSRLDQIIKMEHLVIISGKNRFMSLEQMLYTLLRYENMTEAKYAVLPNYAKIWEEEYEQFVSICKYANNKRVMDRNTTISFQDIKAKNYLYHLQRCMKESNLYYLKKNIPEHITKDYPVVIISAGPSLDKNISQLREYQGRAFIICVDAALNPALRTKIVPDIVISVDPIIKKVKALETELFADLPMVLVMGNSRDMVQNHEGRLFYELDEDGYTSWITGYNVSQNITMESGGSVANNAFSLARILGFKNIILIGQDLAYPNNKLHASEAFENEEDIDVTNGKYFYVDDIYGGRVLTEGNMNMYREWFEKRIENYKELEVIDATEGGALIKGTKIMTLEQALASYCPEQKIDFKTMINHSEYLLDEEARRRGEKKLQKMSQKIDSVINRLQSEKKTYEMLDGLNRKGKYYTKEFRNCVKKIQEFTEYMDSEPEVQLLVRLVSKDSYEMRETIERDEENFYKDIKKIVNSGFKMIDAYVEAGEKIKDMWKEIKRT